MFFKFSFFSLVFPSIHFQKRLFFIEKIPLQGKLQISIATMIQFFISFFFYSSFKSIFIIIFLKSRRIIIFYESSFLSASLDSNLCGINAPTRTNSHFYFFVICYENACKYYFILFSFFCCIVS